MIRAEQVWLAVEPVDMRLGIDGLSLKVQQALGRSPCDGTAYAEQPLGKSLVVNEFFSLVVCWHFVRAAYVNRP